jgi:hypothetical protein
MKYIKHYEENKPLYKTGDYVLLDCDNSIQKYAKITNVSPTPIYDIICFSSKNGDLVDTFVYDQEIGRLLTSKEIEIFNTQINQNVNQTKYNL